jgi:hypothetical protein
LNDTTDHHDNGSQKNRALTAEPLAQVNPETAPKKQPTSYKEVTVPTRLVLLFSLSVSRKSGVMITPPAAD